MSFIDMSINLLAGVIPEAWLTALKILLFLIYAVGLWKVFVKFGESGWKAIIPFYDDYIVFKHIWKPSVFWLKLVSSILLSVGSYFAAQDQFAGTSVQIVGFVVAGVFLMITVFIAIVYASKFSEAFGKGILTAVLIFFLEDLMMIVLGWGDARYRGNPTKKR